MSHRRGAPTSGKFVVRVEIDAGKVGLGYGGGGVAAVEVVNRHFRELLLGRSVNSVEDIQTIWDSLYAASLPYGRKGNRRHGAERNGSGAMGLARKSRRQACLRAYRRSAQSTGAGPMLLARTRYGTARWGSRHTSSRTNGPGPTWIMTMPWHRRDWRVNPLGPDAPVMIDYLYVPGTPDVTREMARRLSEFNVILVRGRSNA